MTTPQITLLNGLPEGPVARAIRAAVPASVHAVHDLGSEIYAPCKGCFECWVKDPGQCGIRDAANPTMRDVIMGDVLLLTTRVRFGTFHPVTKAALDRMIGLISPFFQATGGETHHRARYGAYPHWAVVAQAEPTTSEAERALFVETVRRAALDLHSPPPWVGFVTSDTSPEAISTLVADGIAGLAATPDAPPWAPVLPEPVGATIGETPHVALWVGSAKPPGTSASEKLGTFLVKQLAERGWTHETVQARRVAKLKRGRAPKLVEALRRADLVILASPVYVDTLPALVLEGLSDLRGADLGTTALLPLVQCGFPELLHTETAVAAAAQAAAQLGLRWAGHLAMGGGGVAAGQSIEEAGVLHGQRNALVAAAEALAEGRGVEEATRAAFADTWMSDRAYRSAASFGWLAQAWKHGALARLWDRPFDER